MTLADPRLELADLTPGTGGARVAEALDEHRVIVRAPGARCTSPADQAALFNLVNLAARLFAHVELDVGADPPWMPRFRAGGSLYRQLETVAAAVAPVATANPRRDLVLAWGCDAGGAGVAGDAAGWTYALGSEHARLDGAGSAPSLGGLASSSLMVGQAFGGALAPLGMPFHPIRCFVSNLLDHRDHPGRGTAGGEPLRLARAILAGSGSVGTSLVYAALLSDVGGGPLIAVDPDPFSRRNRLRYPVVIEGAEGPKVDWLAALTDGTQLAVEPHVAELATWLDRRADVPAEQLVLCSVDTVEGRRDATDVLARRTVNVGVSGMALHVANHGFGDDGCAFCQYVDVEPALTGAAMLGEAIGLPVGRVIAVHQNGGRLEPIDVQLIARAKVLRGPLPDVGARLEDLRRRAYAQASLPVAGDAPVLVSAPHVSAMAGLLMLVEAVKESTPGLAGHALRARLDVDTSGQPPGFTLPHRRDETTRCLCWSGFRRRAWRELHAA